MTAQRIKPPNGPVLRAYEGNPVPVMSASTAGTSEDGDAPRQSLRKTHKGHARPPFECIALLLQGGGALGAYQAGVYGALAEAGIHPDWVAGISIGAINSALIAGNPPEARVDKLRQFWERVTDPPTAHAETLARAWEQIAASALSIWPSNVSLGAAHCELVRGLVHPMSGGLTLLRRAPGFLSPRFPLPWLQPAGTLQATSSHHNAHLH